MTTRTAQPVTDWVLSYREGVGSGSETDPEAWNLQITFQKERPFVYETGWIREDQILELMETVGLSSTLVDKARSAPAKIKGGIANAKHLIDQGYLKRISPPSKPVGPTLFDSPPEGEDEGKIPFLATRVATQYWLKQALVPSGQPTNSLYQKLQQLMQEEGWSDKDLQLMLEEFVERIGLDTQLIQFLLNRSKLKPAK